MYEKEFTVRRMLLCYNSALMSLPKDFPQPSVQDIQGSETIVANPRNQYEKLIKDYATLTRRIRQAERLMRSDEISEIEKQRHALHQDLIKPTACKLGIDADQTQLDMIVALGDLEELGIKGIPILRLPMVGNVFNVNDAGITQPRGQYHTSVQMAYPPGDDKDSWPGFDRIKASKERWRKERTFAFLYLARRIASYMDAYSPDLEEILKRRQAIAQDNGLNLFFAYDFTGRHESFPGQGFISPMELYGVEVSAPRLNKITQVIRESPDKYSTGQESFRCFSTPNIPIDRNQPIGGY